MKKCILIFLIVLLEACTLENSLKPKTLENPNEQLLNLFDEYKKYYLRRFPEVATYQGEHQYDNLLTDLSEKGTEQHFKEMERFLKKLNSIDFNNLTHENKLNFELFDYELTEKLEEEPFNIYYTALNQQNGYHIYFTQLASVHPFKTEKDRQNYYTRLQKFQGQVNVLIENMQKGLVNAHVNPKIIMQKVLEQVRHLQKIPLNDNIFLKPLEQTDTAFNTIQKDSLKQELQKSIKDHIIPAYRTLGDFIEHEYLPNCREEIGIWAIPNGYEYYDYTIRKHTNTNLTPDKIFNIGMNEVKRIESQMIKLKNQLGFKDSLSQFINYLRTNPKFYYTQEADLMNGFAKTVKKVDAKLPLLFHKFPQTPFKLAKIDVFTAKSSPAAYYDKAPRDGSRPACFYVNTYNLSSRPKYTMMALTMHETVPGHHFQIALSQEQQGVPWFRNQSTNTAFVEGWALYAEYLGYEMGLYKDLYQYFGALTFEMWRACRLVVDVGIHDKKWTREQAVSFMKKYTASSSQDIEAEVDRYIAWPGQALGYKVGELKIKTLREQTRKKLGKNFDIKEFHYQVLKNGDLPLSFLESAIVQWSHAVEK